MARNEPQMNFRIPADLKAMLEEAAQATGRSLTAEIVHRLQSTFLKRQYDPADLADLVADIDKRLQVLERPSQKPRR